MFSIERDVEWIRMEETASTNTYLKSYVRKNPNTTYAIATAAYQTGGRGQRGNSWESERGKNLLFTIAHYDLPIEPTRQFFISEAISWLIIRTLEKRCPAEAGHFHIKWPNDIYWNDRKLAGILIEHELTPSHIHRTLIGIGLNVNQNLFYSDAPNPVSLLQITGHQTDDKEQIICDLLTGYHEAMQRYARNPEEEQQAIRKSYHDVLYRHGIPSPFRDANGTFQATIEKVEDNGLLTLRDSGGHLRHYAFKEVAFIL